MSGSGPVLETDAGPVQGRFLDHRGRRLAVFLGVPYAAPPTGHRRFRPPEPAEAWSAVRPADRFGPAPMQSATSLFAGTLPGNQVGEVSEDCLTLNVWAPWGAADRPVMVFVPGGAFLTGAGSIPTYDGAALAAAGDVVVVTINYRLGAFGFLWLDNLPDPSITANLGLRDVAFALAFVARHARRLGGDPARVTAFGESAGAGALAHLMASAEPAPVQRLVLQSPGIDHTQRPDDAAVVGRRLLHHLGLEAADLETLRALPAATLLDAQEATVLETLATVSTMPFHPVVDGALLPDLPTEVVARGEAWPVELLLTWTRDELRLFPDPVADGLDDRQLAARLDRLLARRLGADPGPGRAAAMLAAYRSDLGWAEASGAALWAAVTTDGLMRLPAERLAADHRRAGHPVKVGEFAWASRRLLGGWAPGAFHAIDLPFTFGTLDVAGWGDFLGADDGARRLAEQHLAAWAAFAGDGSAATADLGPWPDYDLSRRPTVLLDSPPWRVDDDPLAAVRGVWDGLWSPAGRPAVADLG
jgi:para-nitrobenzyl esterase